MKRTYADVKENLRRVAGAAGLAADSSRLMEIVSLAQENLLAKAKSIPGTVHRLKFCQYQGVIALPARYERILTSSIDRDKTEVVSDWYEFVDYGPGQQDLGGYNVLIDRGESPVIRQPLSGGNKVRVYAYVDERVASVRPTIRIFGYDENGKWVRSGGVDGESLEINGDSGELYTESTNKFSKITQVLKPETNDVLDIRFVDSDDETTTYFAGRYEWWEKNPSFRLYFAPGIPDGETALIHCLATVRFRPVKSDKDELVVSSLPALRHAVRAIAKEDSDDPVAANDSWTLAVQVLNAEALRYFGTTAPLVKVSGATGFGDIPDIL